MKDILSRNPARFCRKCRLIASLLLLFQFAFAQQYNFAAADNWLKVNLNKRDNVYEKAQLAFVKDEAPNNLYANHHS